MKKIKSFIGLLLVVMLFASCSTSDKVVTGNYIQKRKYNKGFYVSTNGKKDKTKEAYNKQLADKPENLTKLQNKYKDIQNNDNNFVELNDNSLIASTDDNSIPAEDNFTISSNNYGNSIRTKIEQKVEKSKNKLRKKINKNVEKIKTSNSVNGGEPKTEGFGLAGFITGLVGLFIFGILFGLIAIIFGAISLGKINKNPDRFKGKGFAITSLILGIIDVVGFLIVLALI